MPPSYTFEIGPTEFVASIHRDEYALNPLKWRRNILLAFLASALLIAAATRVMFVRLPRGWSAIGLSILVIAAIAAAVAVPLVRVMRIRSERELPVTVVADETGVQATHGSGERRSHPWTQLQTVKAQFGGVLLMFRDGAAYRIPSAAFTSEAQRREFVAFASGMTAPALNPQG